MPDKQTIYDVATEAGVAISTVSRVLNHSDEVSPHTRARVEAAIEKLQFRPQRTARSLAQQQTHALAAAMPSFISLFYVEVLKGVKDALLDYDTDLLLCNLGSLDAHETLQRFLNRGAVDALLLASIPIDEHLERELLKLHAPVVVVGTRSDVFDCIYWDDALGAERATRHLIECGHRRIGMIAAHASSDITRRRVAGYRRGLEAGGIDFDPNVVVCGNTMKHSGFSEEAGYEGMEKLLAMRDLPTAVFASSDVKAFGAWAAIRSAGLTIPGDIALIGYDGIKLSRYLGLSTVDQQMYDVGRRVTSRLIEHLHGQASGRMQEEIKPELVERASTGRAQPDFMVSQSTDPRVAP